jgi:hypothetical protein
MGRSSSKHTKCVQEALCGREKWLKALGSVAFYLADDIFSLTNDSKLRIPSESIRPTSYMRPYMNSPGKSSSPVSASGLPTAKKSPGTATSERDRSSTRWPLFSPPHPIVSQCHTNVTVPCDVIFLPCKGLWRHSINIVSQCHRKESQKMRNGV